MSIDRKGLIGIFERLDDALERPQTLCLIGAAAILGLGHVARQTGDLDVWRPASSINDRALSRAGTRADIVVDNASDEPDHVYLQIIRPGIVQLPPFANGLWATGEASVRIWEGDRLIVETAPASVIAAAKLVRADDRDLDDCIFLLRSDQVTRNSILHAARAIQKPEASRTSAENLVLLDVLCISTAEAFVVSPENQADHMDHREVWTLGVDTLGRLLDDDLVLARAVKARDYRRLYAVATIARYGIDENLAMTDPYLYRRLSEAIILMNLKGYGALDIDKLRTLVEREPA